MITLHTRSSQFGSLFENMMEAMEPSSRKNILNLPRILEGSWILIKKNTIHFFGFYQLTCLSHQQFLKLLCHLNDGASHFT